MPLINLIFLLISGNLITIYVILSSVLDLKESFLQLIFTLSVFDSICIIFNITIFSAPLLSEHYRLQVHETISGRLCIPVPGIPPPGPLYSPPGTNIPHWFSLHHCGLGYRETPLCHQVGQFTWYLVLLLSVHGLGRPHYVIPRHSCLAVSFIILIISISVNINRFLEYTTQV